MKIEELTNAAVLEFIFSEEGLENLKWNDQNFYATIGKIVDEAGYDIMANESSENFILKENFRIIELDEESWATKFKRWVAKGIRFVRRVLNKLMDWFCENDIVRNLRSPDSELRKKTVQLIYDIICKTFPRLCKLIGDPIRKIVAYIVKGLTYGVLKVVCPKNGETFQFQL